MRTTSLMPVPSIPPARHSTTQPEQKNRTLHWRYCLHTVPAQAPRHQRHRGRHWHWRSWQRTARNHALGSQQQCHYHRHHRRCCQLSALLYWQMRTARGGGGGRGRRHARRPPHPPPLPPPPRLLRPPLPRHRRDQARPPRCQCQWRLHPLFSSHRAPPVHRTRRLPLAFHCNPADRHWHRPLLLPWAQPVSPLPPCLQDQPNRRCRPLDRYQHCHPPVRWMHPLQPRLLRPMRRTLSLIHI